MTISDLEGHLRTLIWTCGVHSVEKYMLELVVFSRDPVFVLIAGWPMGGGRSGEFGLGQLTSLAMGSPLTARSQSDPGVICTKTLTTAILPCLFLLKISPHLNSEPREDF